MCDELTVAHHEKLQWLERNVSALRQCILQKESMSECQNLTLHFAIPQVLIAASRVLKHVAAEKERSRAEDMLKVCGEIM